MFPRLHVLKLCRRLMMMPMVGDEGLLITDLHDKPGFVSVMGASLAKPKEITCEKAEIFKENYIRAKFGLEKSDEMPPRQGKFTKRCCHCHQPSSLRCSACRSNYCSKPCQKKNWSRHLFSCSLARRPNDADHLTIFVRRWSHTTGDESTQAQILSDLYSDDDLCQTFGFNNCAARDDVAKLLCFYTHMTSKLSKRRLQFGVDEGNLRDFIAVVVALIQHEGKEVYRDCACMTWFLHRQSFVDCIIPNWPGDFAYQPASLRRLERALSIEDRDDDIYPLSESEREVLSLYSILFRDFNNVPGPLTSTWLNFGFCYCTNSGQSTELAKAYVLLAKSGTSLEQIAKAYEEAALPTLMRHQGLDISSLQANGIAFHRPNLEDLGIYRLVAEVNHTLSGRFCYCHTSKSHCHPKFETHLCYESERDYRFHGTNTWERWQLFNFYKYLLSHENFDARKMQEARRHPVKEKLDEYLDSLVPDFRKNIGNKVLGDLMFPKLRARVEFPHGRHPCWCVMHDIIDPEGLTCFMSMSVSQLQATTQSNGNGDLEHSLSHRHLDSA